MGASQDALDARFWLVIGATFLGFLGIGTVLPALGPHVKHDLHGSDQVVGAVIGTFSFVALGSRLFSGPLADRRGRKVTFLMGLLSCACAGAAYLLPIGVTGVYGGRVLQGFGEACLYTGAAVWAVELAGVHRSARALGYLSSGIWGGISAGPVIGNMLGSFAHGALFQVIAALTAFAFVAFVNEDFRPGKRSEEHRILSRELLISGLSIGFVNVHYPVVAGFLILFLTQHGGPGAVAFSAYALVILLSRFFLGGLPDRIPAAITFYGGLVAMASGLLLLAAVPGKLLAVFAAGLLGFGFSFPWSSVASTVLRKTPGENHGSVVAILGVFYDLFVGVSSLVAGRVAERRGYAAAFVMAAVALVGAAIAGRFVFGGQTGGGVTLPAEEDGTQVSLADGL